MPANLTPAYKEAEDRFKQARTDEEKLACLEEMLRVIPKHKGTEKMRKDIKTRISKLRAQLETPKKSARGRKKAFDHVEKHGAAQIVLLGPPNSGKSSLLKTVTAAEPDVADYPYTTRRPQPGMMFFETVQFELVDLPPIAPDYYENWMTNIIRNSDVILLMVDLAAADMLEGTDAVVGKLDELKMFLIKKEIPEEYIGSQFCKRTFIAANKCDIPGATENLEILRELYAERFDIIPISCVDNTNIDKMQSHIFDILQIIRVYTKTPGHDADFTDPVVLPIGSTVEDAAFVIHKDFAHKLQFAKLWGEGKFDGQRVTSKFELADRDIIEFHI
jgi:ribosome-interacting GTPase 1